MIYEIINPSDKYTIKANDLKVAAVACVLLGSGQYGLDPLEEDGERVPIFLFGGSDEWFQKHFNQELSAAADEVMEQRTQELIECFESCLIGGLRARREYEQALKLIESAENRAAFRASRHDERRTSVNDIGGRAYAMAERLREKLPNAIIDAPQQVFVS